MTTDKSIAWAPEFGVLDDATKTVVRRAVEKARTEGTWKEDFRTGDVYAYSTLVVASPGA